MSRHSRPRRIWARVPTADSGGPRRRAQPQPHRYRDLCATDQQPGMGPGTQERATSPPPYGPSEGVRRQRLADYRPRPQPPHGTHREASTPPIGPGALRNRRRARSISPAGGGLRHQLTGDKDLPRSRPLRSSPNRTRSYSAPGTAGGPSRLLKNSLHGATRKTAARDLDELITKGVFKRVGEKRGSHYLLTGQKRASYETYETCSHHRKTRQNCAKRVSAPSIRPQREPRIGEWREDRKWLMNGSNGS